MSHSVIDPNKMVVIVGFMGSGKSTLAKELAKKIPNKIQVDLDELIEKETRQNIRSLFKKYGESTFRKLETKFLSYILNKFDNPILSLGGGTFVSPYNIRLLRKNRDSIIIFLDTPFPVIWERIRNDNNRPLVALGYNNVKRLFLSRIPYYKRGSDLIVRSIEEIKFYNKEVSDATSNG